MKGLCFAEIEMRFDPDNLVFNVKARRTESKIALADLGLTKQNKITPNAQGDLLLDIANGNVTKNDMMQNGKRSTAYKRLNTAFRIDDRPFINYEPEFKLSIPKDTRAKQKKLQFHTMIIRMQLNF